MILCFTPGMATDPTPAGLTARWHTLRAGATPSEALALFDDCAPVHIEEMLGLWRGTELPTDNPLDGLLGELGWYGKQFPPADGAHPLVFTRRGRMFHVKPGLIPVRAVVRLPRLTHTRVVRAVGRAALPLLRTRRPAARLRMVEYRGEVTATMTYDAHPIDDHFRRIDEDTLLGCMEYRHMRTPFFFTLRREQNLPAASV